jgi:Sulfatase
MKRYSLQMKFAATLGVVLLLLAASIAATNISDGSTSSSDDRHVEIGHDDLLKSSNSSNDRPNFILLFMDDLGYGDMGFTGHPTTHTPNLDRLAWNGMVLTTWYSACAACTVNTNSNRKIRILSSISN